MEKEILDVKSFYNENVLYEWERLNRHPFEFEITTKMMDKYIKAGDKVLDIGGGPGRYSLYYAKKGCDVILVDLSEENVEFAKKKANELNVSIKAFSGNAMDIENIVSDEYDHVFIMGPMYHLLNQNDRITAINAALKRLKTGGNLYVSFIVIFAGLIYEMKNRPEYILEFRDFEKLLLKCLENDESYAGEAFTKAFFINQKDILPFMEKFNLEKLHLFGQESIMAPCENNFLSQPKEVVDRWLDIALNLCEKEYLLSYSEHLMYIGRKR